MSIVLSKIISDSGIVIHIFNKNYIELNDNVNEILNKYGILKQSIKFYVIIKIVINLYYILKFNKFIGVRHEKRRVYKENKNF